jgi:hypothetical protein
MIEPRTYQGSRQCSGRKPARARADSGLVAQPQSRSRTGPRRKLQMRWASVISDKDWALYRSAMAALRKAGVPFLLGGGFALGAFTGRWRDTKDIDFYIHPQMREKAVTALLGAGFGDYFEERPYDRKWIYRSVKNNRIVDIIWSMANQRAQVDDLWFERAGKLVLRGEHLLVVPHEEFMWCKLYILQRDHCDWTDLFNLLYTSGPEIDWNHLLWRLENDTALLKALLEIYRWLCAKYAMRLPASLWHALGMQPPLPPLGPSRHNRIRLLDSRGWFVAELPPNRKLEV